MVKQTLKILQQMLKDFKSVSNHFGWLRIEGLRLMLSSYTEVSITRLVSIKWQGWPELS